MKNKIILSLLILPLVVSGCAVARGLVRDVCKVVEAAIDVPIGVATNSVETVKSVTK